MKIVFDHQIFLAQKYGGISRYFCELGQNYSELGNKVDILSPVYVNRYIREVKNKNFNIHGIPLDHISKGVGIISKCSSLVNKAHISFMDYDILHETFFSDKKIARKSKPTFITVYDMIHELYPESFSKNDNTAFLKKESINRADRVISISHSTKNDLINLFGIPEEKIDVIHLSYSAMKNVKKDNMPNKPFVLYVGGRGGYKNFEKTIYAYSQSEKLKNNFNFVCFGGGRWSASEKSLINELGIQNNISLKIGSDEQLAELYSNARCLVYPSLYEGFGLPPLEAMSQSCPCLVSNTSSIPEVCGDAALYFNPLNVDEIKHRLEELCFDDSLQRKLILKGHERIKHFSWQRCAEETLNSYRKLL